eukprot:NODE_7783_length_1550_cov_17.218552.p2 GENE.NODE_7783_length_1550_cov_17.218552~~NODE_7783_length_1550_cov_17.218552.p2  ORF type:complete len:437 (+),score=101.18 NODE_7783_length_1550_cov_17.218552:89-1399(+)
MSRDLKVTLGHVVPDTKPHSFYMRKEQDGDFPAHHGERVSLEVTIRDGRDKGFILDEASFELVQHPTALATKEFYSDIAKVRAQYYDEMKSLFTKATGSPYVHVFHHQVRNQDRVGSDRVLEDGSVTTNTPVQPYALNGIHTDSSCFHAESMFKHDVGTQPEKCRRGRFLYINAWRSIAEEPIVDHHLAVLDERSVVKPDDYIQTTLFGVGYDVLQYNLSSRNARSHKWYYFPKMVKDEVLLFKQWDSDPQRAGRVCFHTAIKDPTAPDGAASRQSIETRAFIFFPEHEPNTCPLMPVATPAVGNDCDEARAQEGANKIAGGVAYVQNSESTRLKVVGFMKAMHSAGGARAILAEFAEDKQGHFGLQTANAATKARAVELCLDKGLAKQVDALFRGPSAARVALRTLWRSRIAAAALGATAALAINALQLRTRALS